MAAAAQRRGGAAALAAGVLLICLCVLLPAAEAAAKTYMVGDAAGWTKNLQPSWPRGKTFYAGDVLVFKYDKERHDLTVVGSKGYRRCKAARHSRVTRVMRTGYDTVTLRRGNNFFICGLPKHCDNGMKLAVKAW